MSKIGKVVLIAAATIVGGATAQEGVLKLCPANQVWLECAGCQATCQNPDMVCIQACQVSGCGCKFGTVLDETTGRCISRKNLSKCGTKPKCPSPFEWQSCKACFTDCNPGVTACMRGCMTGCVCPGNMIYDAARNTCVDSLDECGFQAKTSDECPGQRVYMQEMPDCNRCDDPSIKCEEAPLVEGCACPPEKPWRDVFTGKCYRRRSHRGCRLNRKTYKNEGGPGQKSVNTAGEQVDAPVLEEPSSSP